jgi:beta-phosphoglucomutase
MSALIFDYDGVLADTEPLHWQTWVALLAPYNLSLTWNQYLEFGRGVSDVVFFDALKRLMTKELPDTVWAENSQRKAKVLEWSVENPPISRETVSMLRTVQNRKLALVTTSTRKEVEPVLYAAEIRNFFAACVFGDDVSNHKPDPEPYLRAGRLLNVADCIVFEDSEAGIASAEAAGFRVVKVTDPSKLSLLVFETLSLKRDEPQPQILDIQPPL